MDTPVASLVHGVLLPSTRATKPPGWLLVALDAGSPGVMLCPENLGTPDAGFSDFIAAVHAVTTSPLIASDEEGGEISRLYARTPNPYPGAASLGRHRDPRTVTAVFESYGTSLRTAGITLALGPVADVNTDPGNPVIGVRSLSSHTRTAVDLVAASVRGLRAAGVRTCVKHFPGHGGVSNDTHHGQARSADTKGDLEDRHVRPFWAAFADGCDAVMTSHVTYSHLDNVPGSLSRRVVRGWLRDELGFRGAVITDAMDMHAVSPGPGTHPVVAALRAGADLVCLGPSTTATSYTDTVTAIARALMDGVLVRSELEVSLRRIAQLREPLPPTAIIGATPDWLSIATNAIEVVNGPLPHADGFVVSTADVSPTTAQDLDELGLGRLPHQIGTPAGAGASQRRVLVVRDLGARAHQWDTILAAVAADPALVVVEAGWPGEERDWSTRVPTTVTRLRLWSNSDLSYRAATLMLTAATTPDRTP